MSEGFNIFKWQIDLEYQKEIQDRVNKDPELADEIIGILMSIGGRIGIPFKIEKPETKPKVWVDKGRNTWNTDIESSLSWEVK